MLLLVPGDRRRKGGKKKAHAAKLGIALYWAREKKKFLRCSGGVDFYPFSNVNDWLKMVRVLSFFPGTPTFPQRFCVRCAHGGKEGKRRVTIECFDVSMVSLYRMVRLSLCQLTRDNRGFTSTVTAPLTVDR